MGAALPQRRWETFCRVLGSGTGACKLSLVLLPLLPAMRELALVAAGAAVGGLISLAVARASRRSEAAGRTLRGKVSRVRRVGAKLAFVELKGGSQLKIAHQHLDSGQRVPKKKEVCLGDELEATVLAHSAAGEGPALVRAWRITDKSGAREERKQAAAAKRAKRDRDKQRCRELNRDTARPGADTAAHAAAPGSGEPPARLRRCEAGAWAWAGPRCPR